MVGGVPVGHRIRDQEVVSSIPGCSATRCNSGQVVHTHVPLDTKQYKLVPASAGELTDTPRNALAPYPWSGSVSWCLAEGYGNGDQRRPMGHVAREGLYFTFY